MGEYYKNCADNSYFDKIIYTDKSKNNKYLLVKEAKLFEMTVSVKFIERLVDLSILFKKNIKGFVNKMF